MKNKVIAIIILIIPLVVAVGFLGRDKNSEQSFLNEVTDSKKIKIAVCPTCYEMAKELDPQKYEVIPTSSTAESLEFAKNKQADIMMAGRTLKPYEPKMEAINIKDGYSFISSKSISVNVDELKKYRIYTNLDIELIKNNFALDSIEKVDDVYQYLDKGIVITSWENTDYSKAGIVHVLESNGERVKLSRQPTIYCPDICGQEARELALLLKDK